MNKKVHLPCSKYSLCCFVPGDYPSPGWGYPSTGGGGGYTIFSWLVGLPHPVLAGGYTITGVLPPGLGYSPRPELAYPLERTWERTRDWGTPLWMDRHLWKHYFPHPSDAGSKKTGPQNHYTGNHFVETTESGWKAQNNLGKIYQIINGINFYEMPKIFTIEWLLSTKKLLKN